MSIFLGKKYNLSLLKDAYCRQTDGSYRFLSAQLKSASDRIKFEEWLVNQFSPQDAIDTDFVWHSKVIALLVLNTGPATSREEDLLLARLISKASPLPNKKEGFCAKIARLVHHSAGMALNIKQIFEGFDECDLPITSGVILKRLLEHQSASEILVQAAIQNNLSLVKLILKQHWDEVKDHMLNPLILAIYNEQTEICKLYAEALGNNFFDMLLEADDGMPTLFDAVISRNQGTEILAIVVKFAPDGYLKYLTKQDHNGHTPVAKAAINQNFEVLKFIALTAPEAFREALLLQDHDGNTPATHANSNVEMLSFMHEREPAIFKKALTIRNNRKLCPYDLLKMFRPANYRNITNQIEKNHEVRLLSKEIFNRIALSHFWEIDGTSSFFTAAGKVIIENFDLEGWNSEPWFHLFHKNLEKFAKVYPDITSKEEIEELKEAFHMESKHGTSFEEKLKRIEEGKITFLQGGFSDHVVILTALKSQLAISNLGAEMRRPLDFFNIDSKKFDKTILHKIQSIHFTGSDSDYRNYFFEELTSNSVIFKTPFDEQLDRKRYPLAMQTIGNCSLIGPISAVFVSRIYRGLSKINQLNSEKIETKAMQNVINGASLWYKKWLHFQLLKVLKNGVRSLKEQNSFIKPDLELITKVFHKAYGVKFDSICKQKLIDCTNVYLNLLSEKDKEALKDIWRI